MFGPGSKIGRQPQCEATRGSNGIARKQTSEVDEIQYVCQVLSIHLKLHIHAVRLINVCASGCVN
jgi:hypothetical protein